MPLKYEHVFEAILQAVNEINAALPEDEQISKDPDAPLFGDGSHLDSVGLVNVVMAAEQYVADTIGTEVILASEAAMSRSRSPYRSLRSLAEYTIEILEVVSPND